MSETYWYLSFCDVTRPKGQQFLGATVVLAEDAEGAIFAATELGCNPGGECAMWQLPVSNATDLPPEARKYIGNFVPRDEVMADGGYQGSMLIRLTPTGARD